ncbi:MAG TPA: hypothetical protein VNH83_12195, partial [Bryobacteraceae bacterium]|nr:hypothetical protein [Bryobacteraceae bacterium]
MISTKLFTIIAISTGILAAQTASDEPQSIRSIFDRLATQTPAASSTTLSHTYTIAHFPFGGGFSTRVLLTNSGASDATVDISFLSQTGVPALVPLERPQGKVTTLHLKIAKNQTQGFDADPSERNSGPTTVTWATADASGPLNIFSLFDYAPSSKPTTAAATAINGAVGVQSAVATKTFRFPVSINGPLGYNEGVAIANPNNSNTNVTVKLLLADGTVKDTIQKTLPPNGQISFVLTDGAVFAHDLTASALFNGSVAVCASQPVGLVAIGIEGGAFFTT